MKVLTIIQPWAGLIATGQKRIENRSWNTDYRGPLVIHAGKKWSYDYNGEPQDAAPESQRVSGRLIAIVDLLDTFLIGRCPEKYHPLLSEQTDRGFAVGPYCWVLGDPRMLIGNHQLPLRGQLGLWSLPDDRVIQSLLRRAS